MNMSLRARWGVGLAALLLSGALAGCGEEPSDPVVPDITVARGECPGVGYAAGGRSRRPSCHELGVAEA